MVVKKKLGYIDSSNQIPTKSYGVISSKHLHFDISHVIIPKMWTAVLPVEYLINWTFRLENDQKKRTFI